MFRRVCEMDLERIIAKNEARDYAVASDRGVSNASRTFAASAIEVNGFARNVTCRNLSGRNSGFSEYPDMKMIERFGRISVRCNASSAPSIIGMTISSKARSIFWSGYV